MEDVGVLLTFELWLRMLEEGNLWEPSSSYAHATVDVPRVSRHNYDLRKT